MIQRRERVHHTGASNLTNHPRLSIPNLTCLEGQGANNQQNIYSKSARRSLSPTKNKHFQEPIVHSVARTAMLPMQEAAKYYQDSGRFHNLKTVLGNPRTSHLEEKEKQQIAFIGDSRIELNTNLSRAQPRRPDEKIPAGSLTERRSHVKQRENSLESSNNLKDNVSLDKIKEAKKALRKRYANSKNLQHIWTVWDEEKSGRITVENIYSMSKKLGLGLNFDESRVLLATVDKHEAGALVLDDFVDLIYNKSDAINVDLNSLATRLGTSYRSRKEEAEKKERRLTKSSEGNRPMSTEERRNNQINVVLKNRLKELKTVLYDVDRDKLGYINLASFEEGLNRLRISEAIISDQDIKDLYTKFMIKPVKNEPSKLDYRVFIDSVEKYEFGHGNEHSRHKPILVTKLDAPACPLKVFDPTAKDPANVLPCQKIPSHLQNAYFKKCKRVGKAIQRFFPTKDGFNDYLSKVLGIPKNEIDEHQINRTQLNNVVTQLFNKFDVTNLHQEDFEGFFSCVLYNKNGLTDFKEIQHTIYDENLSQFLDKIQLRAKGPAPLKNTLTAITPDDEREETHKANENSSSRSMNLADKIQQRLVRRAGSVSVRENTENTEKTRMSCSPGRWGRSGQLDGSITQRQECNPELDPELKLLLKSIDDKVFQSKKSAYEAFREFDVDGDGYVSHNDAIAKLQSQHLLKDQDRAKFLSYIDPQQKGYLDFNAFAKKIRPNMVFDNEEGRPRQNNITTFCKPDVERELLTARLTKAMIDNYKRAHDPYCFDPMKSQRKTRSGANPSWTNTFLNFQPKSTASMFISEGERLHVDKFSKTRFQIEERERKRMNSLKRLETLKETQNNIRLRIEQQSALLDRKELSNLQRSHLAQEAYERNANLQNKYI